MAETVLMKGNEALAEAALRAGLEGYFAYPITPQSEIPEYLAGRLPDRGGVFLQAESEIASINMLYGAAGCGFKVMTSSSSPGISLMQEGISYIAAAELPCVIVNVMRGGPGLGTIQPAQADYFQSTRGGGHGDYRLIVLAPSTVQEIADLTYLAFDLAWKYRNPVLLLLDGALGQMMEKVAFQPYEEAPRDISWATRGKPREGPRRIINTLHIEPDVLERINTQLQEKYREIARQEVRYEGTGLDDAEVVIVAYGTSARIAAKAMQLLRARGYRVGLLKPLTLWPYPSEALAELSRKVRGMFVPELSAGQMIEDVRLAVEGRVPVGRYNRTGGAIYSPEEIAERLADFCRELGLAEGSGV